MGHLWELPVELLAQIVALSGSLALYNACLAFHPRLWGKAASKELLNKIYILSDLSLAEMPRFWWRKSLTDIFYCYDRRGSDFVPSQLPFPLNSLRSIHLEIFRAKEALFEITKSDPCFAKLFPALTTLIVRDRKLCKSKMPRMVHYWYPPRERLVMTFPASLTHLEIYEVDFSECDTSILPTALTHLVLHTHTAKLLDLSGHTNLTKLDLSSGEDIPLLLPTCLTDYRSCFPKLPSQQTPSNWTAFVHLLALDLRLKEGSFAPNAIRVLPPLLQQLRIYGYPTFVPLHSYDKYSSTPEEPYDDSWQMTFANVLLQTLVVHAQRWSPLLLFPRSLKRFQLKLAEEGYGSGRTGPQWTELEQLRTITTTTTIITTITKLSLPAVLIPFDTLELRLQFLSTIATLFPSSLTSVSITFKSGPYSRRGSPDCLLGLAAVARHLPPSLTHLKFRAYHYKHDAPDSKVIVTQCLSKDDIESLPRSLRFLDAPENSVMAEHVSLFPCRIQQILISELLVTPTFIAQTAPPNWTLSKETLADLILRHPVLARRIPFDRVPYKLSASPFEDLNAQSSSELRHDPNAKEAPEMTKLASSELSASGSTPSSTTSAVPSPDIPTIPESRLPPPPLQCIDAHGLPMSVLALRCFDAFTEKLVLPLSVFSAYVSQVSFSYNLQHLVVTEPKPGTEGNWTRGDALLGKPLAHLTRLTTLSIPFGFPARRQDQTLADYAIGQPDRTLPESLTELSCAFIDRRVLAFVPRLTWLSVQLPTAFGYSSLPPALTSLSVGSLSYNLRGAIAEHACKAMPQGLREITTPHSLRLSAFLPHPLRSTLTRLSIGHLIISDDTLAEVIANLPAGVDTIEHATLVEATLRTFLLQPLFTGPFGNLFHFEWRTRHHSLLPPTVTSLHVAELADGHAVDMSSLNQLKKLRVGFWTPTNPVSIVFPQSLQQVIIDFHVAIFDVLYAIPRSVEEVVLPRSLAKAHMLSALPPALPRLFLHVDAASNQFIAALPPSLIHLTIATKRHQRFESVWVKRLPKRLQTLVLVNFCVRPLEDAKNDWFGSVVNLECAGLLSEAGIRVSLDWQQLPNMESRILIR